MNTSRLLQQLIREASLLPARLSESSIPESPGLYTIFISSPDELPAPFSDRLKERRTTLIYLGKANNSLMSRLVEEDLRHKRPSTFFRAIGPIFGYRPPAGSLQHRKNQKNYKFSPHDTEKIIDWINEHLRVRYVVIENPEKYEDKLIEQLRPLLNTQHNPDALPVLASLREECRKIARGDFDK